MADPSATRYGLEALFLILLAVAVGFADFDTWLIAVVMGCGWLLVSTIEWLAWRASRPAPPPAVLPPAPTPLPGWDVQEIIAPVVEDQPEPEEQTTVLPPEQPEPEPEPAGPKRRWLRRSRGSE